MSKPSKKCGTEGDCAKEFCKKSKKDGAPAEKKCCPPKPKDEAPKKCCG